MNSMYDDFPDLMDLMLDSTDKLSEVITTLGYVLTPIVMLAILNISSNSAVYSERSDSLCLTAISH